MSIIRGTIGAVFGAAVAGVALRVRRESQRRGVSPVDLISDVPSLIGEDLRKVRDAAEGAMRDGQRAARATEQEIDKVLSRPRQTGESS